MTLVYPFGIDVSKWQASQDGTKRMDWQKAKSAGIEFAFCRATYGAYYVDEQFAYNWSEMKRLPILRGAYHYYLPTHPLSQIQMFVDLVEPQAGERLVLDFEYSGNLPKDVLTVKVGDALELVKRLTGQYPIGYSRASWMNANLLMGAIPNIDWWLAQYLSPRIWPLFTPEYNTQYIDIPRGVTRSQIKFHQTGERGDGRKYGAQSYYIDTNRFLGTADELTAYFGHTHNVYLPIVITPPAQEPDPLYRARVIADVLNIRSEPVYPADNVVGQLTEGTTVNVYEERVGRTKNMLRGVTQWTS